MKNYLIRTGLGEAFNAASKARMDADAIAVSRGYEPFVFQGNRTGNGAALAAVKLALDGMHNWNRLIREAEPKSRILIQYPHYPLKSAVLIKRMMRKAKQERDLRFIALVHDLDSLRGLHGKPAAYSDEELLPEFDAIICHNERMKAYLVKKGIPAKKLIALGVFDYLTDAVPSLHRKEDGIAVAGNLDPEKCGYVQAWIRQLEGGIPVHLYGKGLEGTEMPGNVTLHGTVPPQELPGVITGGFGLVWDGESAETCSGSTGNYLRWNNPHKLSLYLASGMPVILWKEAAAADFVRERKAGFSIGSLAKAEEAVHRVTETEYRQMAEAARKIGAEIRKGEFLRRALQEAERITE